MKRMLFAALLGALASTGSAQQSPVVGTWLTASGKAQVRIGPCADPSAGPVCGYIVRLNNPTGPNGEVVSAEVATDWRNSDAALRSPFGETQYWSRVNQ